MSSGFAAVVVGLQQAVHGVVRTTTGAGGVMARRQKKAAANYPIRPVAETAQVADSGTGTYLALPRSTLFAQNQKFLRDECGLPCWICGATGKQSARVVQHLVSPRLWSELSTPQVTALVRTFEVYDDRYLAAASQRALLDMVLDAAWSLGPVSDPDDIRNLVVVCEEHGRRPSKRPSGSSKVARKVASAIRTGQDK